MSLFSREQILKMKFKLKVNKRIIITLTITKQRTRKRFEIKRLQLQSLDANNCNLSRESLVCFSILNLILISILILMQTIILVSRVSNLALDINLDLESNVTSITSLLHTSSPHDQNSWIHYMLLLHIANDFFLNSVRHFSHAAYSSLQQHSSKVMA